MKKFKSVIIHNPADNLHRRAVPGRGWGGGGRGWRTRELEVVVPMLCVWVWVRVFCVSLFFCVSFFFLCVCRLNPR